MSRLRVGHVAAVVGWTVAGAGLVGAVRQGAEARAVRSGRIPPVGPDGLTAPRRRPGPFGRRMADWVPPRPRTLVGRTLAAVWAAPLTLVGLVAAAGRRPHWDERLGALVVRGGRGPSAAALRLVGADANALGQVILCRGDAPTAALLRHEAVHVRQAERLGPLLVPLYLWWNAVHGYRDHPIERAARLGARETIVTTPV